MTKAVLEAKSEGDAWKTTAAVPSSAMAVPASLHASLMARLDRLGSAKEVAQIGAAIGREFSHSLLAAVVGEPEAKLQSALDRLVTAGLLFRQGVPPHATYLFKHALVQDAAYGTLLRDARRALHARLANAIERNFAEVAENRPELLARHCAEAGLVEKAALLSGKAGQRALDRSALVEAVALLVQDAAYGTLLRDARRALHARLANAIERNFAEVAENRPELLARHCAEAGLVEKAALLSGKAGQRALDRSALVEAVAQFTRALHQIASLPRNTARLHEEIKLQVALITPLMHVKGHAAPETKAAEERARTLIAEADALGEPVEDPLLLFSVLFGIWIANLAAFDGNVIRALDAEFLALAKQQSATLPLMTAHRLMGVSAAYTDALGEPVEDPLLLFSVLFGIWIANLAAFDGNVIRALDAEFLALAKQQSATLPLMTAHRLMGVSAAYTGAVSEGRAHYNEALALYDPHEHRSLAGRFSTDTRATVLSFRSQALWLLGYPDQAVTDASNALEQAREIGHAATLMVTLTATSICYLHIGDYAAASALSEELVGLAHEKDAPIWKGFGMLRQGQALAMTGQTFHAVERIVDGLSEFRSTKATLMMPWCVSYLAEAHAELRQFDEAWRRIDEATSVMEASNERWAEPEINRVAGELARKSAHIDRQLAETYFERALEVARQQQAKSWELRASMSLARLWRDQGKPQQARELLAPVYGWFTEGFDTLDLKEAKALLDELAA